MKCDIKYLIFLPYDIGILLNRPVPKSVPDIQAATGMLDIDPPTLSEVTVKRKAMKSGKAGALEWIWN